MPELIGARLSTASVAGVVGLGAKEGKRRTGVLVSGSPGLEGRRSGGALAVKAYVGRALVRVTQGSKWGKEEQWEERMPGRPLIGSEGERGGRVPYPGSRKQNRSIYTCVQDV
jgi:hypothetical protein